MPNAALLATSLLAILLVACPGQGVSGVITPSPVLPGSTVTLTVTESQGVGVTLTTPCGYDAIAIVHSDTGPGFECFADTQARFYQQLEDEYADYNRVARAFVVAIGNPTVMRTLTRVGIRSTPLMAWVLKVMANLLEPEEKGMAEHIYGTIERIVRIGPEPKIAV